MRGFTCSSGNPQENGITDHNTINSLFRKFIGISKWIVKIPYFFSIVTWTTILMAKPLYLCWQNYMVRVEFLSILTPGSFAAEYATCVVKKVGDCREGTISQQMKFNALPDNLDPIIAQFLAQGIAKLIQNVINCI